MNIKIGEYVVRVHINEQSEITSKHTGSKLKKLSVDFSVKGESINEEILSLINSAKRDSINSVDETGKIISQWKIGNSSWKYTEGNPIYTHNLELQEMENLELEELRIGVLTLKPYMYKEEIRVDTENGKEKLEINARVEVSKDEHEQLKKLYLSRKEAFQVIRKGIAEAPQKMVIEIDSWSKNGDLFKHHIALSEENEMEIKPIFPILHWVGATTNQAVLNTAVIEGILRNLENKGILSSEEIAKINSDATEQQEDRKYELNGMDDIDKFEF